ncbi:hypothetical protein JKP88DRAFT_263476 [Tribonema minus]|uniref:Uncharacterized protein n=1 Tax=Tribonema minus TaxID=303371 RepID=A0A836CE55_9STRA|nr:hypothetical protein JKP88DRAFT_263476 [Tribonema minus]
MASADSLDSNNIRAMIPRTLSPDVPSGIDTQARLKTATAATAKDLFTQHSALSTALGCTLSDCIVGGVVCPTHPVGLWAADAECYALFSSVFLPIVQALHPRCGDVLQGWQHPIDGAWQRLLLDDPDPWYAHITSVRVSAARNVAGVRLAPAMMLGDRQKLLSAVADACGQRLGGLPGGPHALGDLLGTDMHGSQQEYSAVSPQYTDGLFNEMGERLRQHGLLPPPAGKQLYMSAVQQLCPQSLCHSKQFHLAHMACRDPYKAAAHVADNWPVGRGVWTSDDHRLAVWINAEDHIRVIATEEVPAAAGDAADAATTAYARLGLALAQIAKVVPFEVSPHLGYVTTSPALLGTALRVSVAVQGIVLGAPHAREVCDALWMDADDLGQGEFLVSNQLTLGISEVDTVREVLDCVAELIKLERRLAKAHNATADSTSETHSDSGA